MIHIEAQFPLALALIFSSIFFAGVQSVAASDGHSTFKSVCQAALPASSGEAVEGGDAVESEQGYDRNRKVPTEPHGSPNSHETITSIQSI